MVPLRTFNNARRQKLMIKILKTGKLLEKNLVSNFFIVICYGSIYIYIYKPNTMYTTI